VSEKPKVFWVFPNGSTLNEVKGTKTWRYCQRFYQKTVDGQTSFLDAAIHEMLNEIGERY